LKTTKSFDKQYSILDSKIKISFKNRLELFKASPFDARLRNHSLKGKYFGYRSINITGDVRALYAIRGNMIIIFGFVGSRSQLYISVDIETLD